MSEDEDQLEVLTRLVAEGPKLETEGKTWLRVVKSPREGGTKYASRHHLKRVEVVRDDEVVATLEGLKDIQFIEGLDTLSMLQLTCVFYDEVVEA